MAVNPQNPSKEGGLDGLRRDLRASGFWDERPDGTFTVKQSSIQQSPDFVDATHKSSLERIEADMLGAGFKKQPDGSLKYDPSSVQQSPDASAKNNKGDDVPADDPEGPQTFVVKDSYAPAPGTPNRENEAARLSELAKVADGAQKRFQDSLSAEKREAYSKLKGIPAKVDFENEIKPDLSTEQLGLLNQLSSARSAMMAGLKESPFYEEYKEAKRKTLASEQGQDVSSAPSAGKAEVDAVSLTDQQRQAYLHVLGYKTGALDGDMGPVTKAALKQLAEESSISTEKGLDMAAIDRELKRRVSGTKSAQDFIEESRKDIENGVATRADIKALQWVLKGNGADMPVSLEKNGAEMDGLAGSETRAAITNVLTRLNAPKPSQSAAESVKTAASSDAQGGVTTLPTITVTAQAQMDEPVQEVEAKPAAPVVVAQAPAAPPRPSRGSFPVFVVPGSAGHQAVEAMRYSQAGVSPYGYGQAADQIAARHAASPPPAYATGPFVNRDAPVISMQNPNHPVRQGLGVVTQMARGALRGVTGPYWGAVDSVVSGAARSVEYEAISRERLNASGQFNAASGNNYDRMLEAQNRASTGILQHGMNQGMQRGARTALEQIGAPGINNSRGLFGAIFGN